METKRYLDPRQIEANRCFKMGLVSGITSIGALASTPFTGPVGVVISGTAFVAGVQQWATGRDILKGNLTPKHLKREIIQVLG